MGIRLGVLIGFSGLLLPILATFIVMAIVNIDLQRVSLGALIIAMGMMVDNAIVIADGFVSRLQQGMERTKAAIEAAKQGSWPLLGATFVACMAFYPIFASTFDTGEYARSLFQVVAIALLTSWVLSQTITPLLCIHFIPGPKTDGAQTPLYGSRGYRFFKQGLITAMKYRRLVAISMLGLLALSIYAFQFVPREYFPDSSRLQLMVDYWAPEGTRIQQVSKDIKPIEKYLMDQPQVTAVSSFIGQGPPRFYLPVNPEDPYSSYAQLIVNTKTFAGVSTVLNNLQAWAVNNVPQAVVRVRKYAVGAFDDWKFEARFSGPRDATPRSLRHLGQQGIAILNKSKYAKDARTNWRQRVRRIDVNYDESRARWSAVTRKNVGTATKRVFEGNIIGIYREADNLIPIVVRNTAKERKAAIANLDTIQVALPARTFTIPLGQMVKSIEIKWEDPIIQRWDRRRALTVQASPNEVTAPTMRDSVLAAFEAIQLLPGYKLEWDGEYKSSKESIEALIPGIIPTIIIILFIIVALFNAYRPPLIILMVIPFCMIGITLGLLVTQVPFGFIALLGGMSLSGMIIKNVVVLLDQVNINIANRMQPYDAVVDAAVSRLRPVMNAAATTVFGMIPLLQDVFWTSLAVTVMSGLAFATLLTMILVPVFYAILYKLPYTTSAAPYIDTPHQTHKKLS